METQTEGMIHREDERRPGGQLVAGGVLIIIGLGLFALQFTEGLGDSVITFFIGALFLAGYLYRRRYGLLIPAGILMGIGLGNVGEQAFFSMEGMSSIGLGIGFLSIYIIGRAYQGSTPWWPLIPGGILLVTGLASSSDTFAGYMEIGWPLILVLVGLVLLFGATEFRRGR
ncbi:MAG: hypothetical protein WBR18_06140 [Anaerolineales bacterium]